MEMNIMAHENSEFGHLTSITSPTTKKVMFIGQEASLQWGHKNLTQAIKAAKLEPNEMIVIDLKNYTAFKKQLTNLKLVGGRASSVTLITESGLYKMAMASRLEKGIQFRDWIAKEVLPSIRETGTYSISSISVSNLVNQSIREVQINNSKAVNAMNITTHGVAKTIDYNRDNCKQVTGMEPNEIKKLTGKKSKSAKEILRQTNPEYAATMSLNDFLVTNNSAKLSELKSLDKAAVQVFKEINKLGFKIIE